MVVSTVARFTWRMALRTLARIAIAFVVYVGVQLAILAITDSPVWATVGSAISTIGLYWALGIFTPAEGAGHYRLPRRSAWIWGVGLIVVWLAGQSLAIWLAGAFPEAAAGYERRVEELAATPVLVTLLLTLVLAPVAEELLMRGVLYRELRRGLRLPVWVAVLVSAVIFAVMHGNVIQIGATLLLGALLALAYEHTGSILVPIGLHGLYNVLSTFVPATVVAPFANDGFVWVLNGFVLLALAGLCLIRGR